MPTERVRLKDANDEIMANRQCNGDFVRGTTTPAAYLMGTKTDGQECPSYNSLREVLVVRVSRRFEVGEQIENLVV